MPATLTLHLDLTGNPRIYPARLHGAACALTGHHGTGHHGPPFAVGPLADHPDGTTTWRLGWLTDDPPPTPPATITFGDTPCSVLHHTTHTRTYAQLATSPPARHAHLTITTPLYFSRNGHDHPLPDPALLYRSAATRWNHHAPTPLTIPDHDLHDLRKHTYITHLDGQTTQAPVSATMNQTGFIGQLHLALTRHTTPTTRTLFATLTHYLTIAGAGAQTTHGFGSLHLDKLTP
ncbi:hypothetical protein GCM10023148_00650 [Actinokineospora soli]